MHKSKGGGGTDQKGVEAQIKRGWRHKSKGGGGTDMKVNDCSTSTQLHNYAYNFHKCIQSQKNATEITPTMTVITSTVFWGNKLCKHNSAL